MKTTLLIILAGLFSVVLQGQKKVSNKAGFKDGIYKSHAEFKANSPSVALKEIVKWRHFIDADSNVIHFDETLTLKDNSTLNQGDFWGVCVDGQPFKKAQYSNEKFVFIRLHVIGKLNYFYYKAIEFDTVVMNVHNPFTGVRVVSEQITNEVKVIKEKLMKFENGEISNFTVADFMYHILDDEQLSTALRGFPEEEQKDRLFKTLLIYNDRHPVYFSKN